MGQKVFMTKGDGEHGYSRNSAPLRYLTDLFVFPTLDEALQHVSLPTSDKPIVVADLGSSSCPHSIVNASYVVESLRSLCLKSSRSSEPKSPKAQREFQVYFNDLPWNDFNTLFEHLRDGKADRSNFFAAGVPGSFFDRLFPSASVHVFISILSAHYLSKIPETVMDEKSPAFNKGKVWIEGSTDATAQAYEEQYALDLKLFLRARSEELVPGGLLYFILKTRPSRKAHVLRAADDSFDALQVCLRETADDVLAKEILTEQQLNVINVPVYYPLFEDELLEIIKSFESTFEIVTAEEIGFPLFLRYGMGTSSSSDSNHLVIVNAATGFIRSILGGMFEQVMGDEQQEIFWQHFANRAVQYASDFKQICHFGCISLLKR